MSGNLNHDRFFRTYVIALFLSFGVLFGATWWWVIQEPMAYMRRDYPMWMAKLKLARESHASLVVLGDSRAVAAIIPAKVGPGVVNLALGGSTPIEDFYMERIIISEDPPPQAVLLSFTPYQFVHADWFWEYGVKYGLLNSQDVNEVRRLSRSLKDNTVFSPKSPGDLDVRLEAFLYSIKFPPFYFSSIIHSGIFMRYQVNLDSWNHVLEARGQSYFGQESESTLPDNEVSLKSFTPSKTIDVYFDRMLALSQSRHIPVYFLSMPHNTASTTLYSPVLKVQFVDYLNQYARRYPGFHILGDPLNPYPPDCFTDANHLNPKGAERWSDYMAKLLTDSHVEGGPFGPQ